MGASESCERLENSRLIHMHPNMFLDDVTETVYNRDGIITFEILVSLPLLLIYKRQPNPLAWEPKPEPSKPNKK